MKKRFPGKLRRSIEAGAVSDASFCTPIGIKWEAVAEPLFPSDWSEESHLRYRPLLRHAGTTGVFQGRRFDLLDNHQTAVVGEFIQSDRQHVP